MPKHYLSLRVSVCAAIFVHVAVFVVIAVNLRASFTIFSFFYIHVNFIEVCVYNYNANIIIHV